MKNSDLDNLYWHDGNLISIAFEIGESGSSSLIISAMLYPDENEKERKEYEICCFGVKRFNSGIDAMELKENAFAGNIMNGYRKNNHLWVYFTDGVLEVVANGYEVKKC